MPPRGESIRGEAARRGVTTHQIRTERLQRGRGADAVTFRQRREERFRQQKIRNIRALSPEEREAQAPWVRADIEDVGQFPAPAEAPWEREEAAGFPLVSTEEPHGFQGPWQPSPDPDWDYYSPTRTAFPDRPRTVQSRYSRKYQTLEVEFRDGTYWHYDEVPPGIWNRFKRIDSPGRYINAVLNGYPYGQGGFGSILGE
jgi:hypothetical protein